MLRNVATAAGLSGMINGGDILVLVRLLSREVPWTFRSMAAELVTDPAALHRAVGRLKAASLLHEDRNVNRAGAEEFLVHAVRYVVPGELGAHTRGIPTAWGAEPLSRMVHASSDASPVWPDPRGSARGPRLDPIAPNAPKLAMELPGLGEWLTLVDAIRVGRARERKLASEEVAERIWADSDER